MHLINLATHETESKRILKKVFECITKSTLCIVTFMKKKTTYSKLYPTFNKHFSPMCGSCHFDRALNDEFSVKFLLFVLIIFSAGIKIRSEIR